MITRYARFSLDNGYCGCQKEEYLKLTFEDDTTEEKIEETFKEYFEEEMYQYLETYEYVARGWDDDWETEEDEEAYYCGDYCGWELVSEEEYKENSEEEM